jgi:hypothetical protein
VRIEIRRQMARVATVLACCLAALTLVPGAADAHPLSTSAVLLDVGADVVTGQIQLPLDRLAIALEQPGLTPAVAGQPTTLERLQSYVAAHVSAADPADGASWAVSVTHPRLGIVDGVEHLLLDVALHAPTATAGLTLRYDAIVHRLLSHRVLVSSRPAGTDDAYTVLGVLDWQTQTVDVPTHDASTLPGFLAAVALGVHHIGEGADHLLFLLMLLLPAPLLVRRGRWVRADDLGRQVRRIVHVVSSFALGHSLTLVLAAAGVVSVPARVVESLIAVSILVSGVHAVRPVVRGGEVWIAGVFGLMHGLAFAALLGPLDLTRGSLVADLLGFNLGIEITQLLVVALVMPSLIVLSRSRAYPVVRTALAGLGILLAAVWLAQRTALIATDPFDGLSETLVRHPLVLPAVLALAAAVVLLRRPRTAVVPTSSATTSTPEGDRALR